MSGPEPVVGQSEGSPRTIKRYANRKLYDTRDSQYVTLQQIAVFVRAGEEVEIIDNKTKEDLTNVTLAQIIYEEQKKGDKKAARSLRNFIQEGRDKLMTSLREGPVGKLVARREGEAQAPEDEASGRVDDPSGRVGAAWEELSRMADERVRGLMASALGHANQLQAEVKRLQGRIEELEGRIVALTRRGKGSDSDAEGEAEPDTGAGQGESGGPNP